MFFKVYWSEHIFKVPRYKIQIPNNFQISITKFQLFLILVIGDWEFFVSCFLYLGYLVRMFKKSLQIIWQLIWHRLLVRFQQFIKYCAGGGLAFVTDAGLLFIFTEYGHLWYLISATFSFLIAAVVNYSFQYFVTFKDNRGQIKKQFTLFVIIAAVGLAINNSLLYIQVEWFGLWYMLAKVIAAVIVLIWNFMMNKYYTFKSQ